MGVILGLSPRVRNMDCRCMGTGRWRKYLELGERSTRMMEKITTV